MRQWDNQAIRRVSMYRYFVIGLFWVHLATLPVSAQLFHKRERYCPPGGCSPSMPGPATDDVPQWAVKAACEIHNNGVGGTGCICGTDQEAGKAYVMTCRHVVSSGSPGLYVKLANGKRANATFLGYSTEADVALLEIDSTDIPGHVGIYDGDIYSGQEVYQVGYGINASRVGEVNKRSGKIVRPSGYVGEQSYDVSFMLISGDSGSPIYDAKTGQLLGIGWGHDGNNGKITGPKAMRDFFYTCLRKRNRKPPANQPGNGIKPDPSKPAEPNKPVEPSKPLKECQCDPAAIKAIADRLAALEKTPGKSDPATAENTSNINSLTQNVNKITELIMNQSKSIDGLAASVSQLDKRVSALENRPTGTSTSTVSRIVPVKP